MQADIFTYVALPKGLVNSHACIRLAFIRQSPSKFPGVIEIVDSKGLQQAFGFQRDWNSAAILQLYATCFFHNREVTWMTGEARFTATYSQFVKALGFRSAGYRIHAANQKDKPKELSDFLRFIAPGLDTDDRTRKPNDISI